uniref:Putative transcription activator n=1 Tax=Trypanosoma congolense (strain IL3000) TaxID=1068625 RepID=G0UJ87_TRYCI|nr:putative transcription activator [Trypanosoma congolense IL3000]
MQDAVMMNTARKVRQRQDLDTVNEASRQVSDFSAVVKYERILLECVRSGEDPNALAKICHFEGYVEPTFDPVRGARLVAERRQRLLEICKRRESVVQRLRSTPEHQQLSAFDRLLRETEYWMGIREPCDPQNGSAMGAGANVSGEGEWEETETLHITESPTYIRGKLRPYQIEGVNWLLGLYSRCINGILADEMGLGKTLQTIAALAYLKFTHGLPGPHLVVCPASVMENWCLEIRHWCPAFKVLGYHCPSDIRQRFTRENLMPYENIKYDIVVTTYEMVFGELNLMKKIPWQYLIVDEAHKLKNDESRAHSTLDAVHSNYRLIITGTPLQNDLRELWALLHFLAPRLFNDSDSFESWFDTVSGQQDSEALTNMHRILLPLMLRRLKSEVGTGIPPKKEIYVSCKLTKLQKRLYMQVLAKDADVINKNVIGSLKGLSDVLMNMRKVINHPYMMQGVEEGPPFVTDERLVKYSGKMMLLDKLLHRLLRDENEKHKVLIFSQFTTMLDILEDYCTMRGFKICRIDGGTSLYNRNSQMAAFNAPNSDRFIFLLSTRAGGVGINLQAANHVIIYDSDWNPQMDLQAQDRAHRIGQQRLVRVYRFITDGTLEERMYQRALKKLYLDAMVVQQSRVRRRSGNSDMSREEILSAIRFGAEEIFRARDEDVTEADIDRLFDDDSKAREVSDAVLHQVQMSLASFRLGADELNLYEFEGIKFRSGTESRLLHITLSDPVSQDELYRQCSEFDTVKKVVLHPNLTEALVTFQTTSGAINAKHNLPYTCEFAAKEVQAVVPKEVQDWLNVGESLGRGHRQRGTVPQQLEGVASPADDSEKRVRPKLPREPKFPPHQLFNVKRLLEIHRAECDVIIRNAERRSAAAKKRGGDDNNSIINVDRNNNTNNDNNNTNTGSNGDVIHASDEVVVSNNTIGGGEDENKSAKPEVLADEEVTEGQPEQQRQQKQQEEGIDSAVEVEEETLNPVFVEEREKLLKEGFPNWSLQEYRMLIQVLVGGSVDVGDYASITSALQKRGSDKTLEEVRQYVAALLDRGSQYIPRFQNVEAIIERNRIKRKQREDEIQAAKQKVESLEDPESQLTFRVRNANIFDTKLFLMAYDSGFSQKDWGEVLRQAPESRFDIWLQSRNRDYFDRRLRTLMSSVKREWEAPTDEDVGQHMGRRRRRTEP